MASAFAHAFVAYTGTKLYPRSNYNRRILFFAVICSIAPDIDSIGFFLGIPYGELFGHRGISHSLFFAFVMSLFLVQFFFVNAISQQTPDYRYKYKVTLVIFFTVIMSSHGLLDAMTNGGLGVAFFSPFDNSRYFLPWRPISVSPIGIQSFFSEWGLRVIVSEALWIGLPCCLILILKFIFNLIVFKKNKTT